MSERVESYETKVATRKAVTCDLCGESASFGVFEDNWNVGYGKLVVSETCKYDGFSENHASVDFCLDCLHKKIIPAMIGAGLKAGML